MLLFRKWKLWGMKLFSDKVLECRKSQDLDPGRWEPREGCEVIKIHNLFRKVL